MKKIIVISILYLLIFSLKGYGQAIPEPVSMEVYLQVLPTDTTNLFGDTLFAPNTQLSSKMVIELQDTSNIASINIEFGTSSGNHDLLQKNFSFDQAGTFSDGTSYLREGLIVYLGLGNFIGLNSIYAEVKLQGTSGYITPAVLYNN